MKEFMLGVLLIPLGACGMNVRIRPIGDHHHPANLNQDLRFYDAPFEGMEAIGLIEIEGENFDKYQEVRRRASEEAARLGADALVVVREVRQDGSFWQYTGRSYEVGDWVYKKYEKVRADYPVCAYIAVRQVPSK